MKNLVHFSLKYDCTESLLEVLAENCSRTLRILDIERSQHVKGGYNYPIKLESSSLAYYYV